MKTFFASLAVFALAMTVGAVPAAAQDAPSGGFKIGVVNMKEAFQGYERQKKEYEKLKSAQSEAQAKVDKLSDSVKAKKEKYDANKDKMSKEEAEQLQTEIQKEFSEYQAEYKKLQDDISLQEDKLLRDLFQEIKAAVGEVAKAEGYHLVLEAGSDPNSTVLYYATSLNLTSKVVDYLNKTAK